MTTNSNNLNNDKPKPDPTKANKSIICGQWNIKRGLLCRETELKRMLLEEEIGIMFLTETDTKTIICESDYKIQGFQTIFHERKNPNDVLRVICLIKEELVNNMQIRFDLMDCDFPSIWIELKKVITRGA